MALPDLSYLGTTSNRITFNDYDTTGPLFRMTKRAPTRREVREFDLAIPETDGVSDFQTLIGKMYFIIEGKMYANVEADFWDARRTLRSVSSLQIEQNDSASDAGYVPYQWTEEQPKQMMVKVLYADMDETTARGLTQPFRLICKIKYPVITDTQSSNLTLTTGTTTAPVGGGLIPMLVGNALIGGAGTGTVYLPMTLPAVLGSQPLQAGSTVNNPGNLPSWPTIVIYGPISKPKLVQTSTGAFLELNDTLNTGDSAIITYDQDSLSVTSRNLNAYGLLTSGSTLFKIQPGINAFQLTGASTGTGASAQINFFPTYPIS